MINYNKFVLDNGLTVIHHLDESTQLCVLNILYRVGSRDENPEKTGFAHLFEHLMFGGSQNISEFDTALQTAGGESNAFTSNDITNYYVTLPANNIETAFWLDSDRMLSLDFNQKSLDTQKRVVIEEFRERYLNQPYGDVWLKILPLAYKTHPYQWPTIGKEISHIENANLQDVKDFFFNFYAPNNAIMVVAGNVSLEETKRLCNKWFGPIKKGDTIKSSYKKELVQTEARIEHIYNNVPLNLLVKAYHMGGRLDSDYYACDLLSDILASGKSSRMFNNLVKEKRLFSELDTYISGDVDPGLFLIEGKLMPGIDFEAAELAIAEELEKLKTELIPQDELIKVQNKTETNVVFGDINILNRAMKLAFAEFIGDIELANTEIEHYLKVSPNNLKEVAVKMFVPENCSTLYYHAKK
ncbi:MAG: insulinase family protein [Bacteroidia bacterium]|nr:insulinase family protein [Bacteroidia bacterium]MCF8426340.1 insulinase family protein [Bacteroidia bacterium]MCF8445761.1 insulinase family protein [Bacteroidia bacterium]